MMNILSEGKRQCSVSDDFFKSELINIVESEENTNKK